MCKRLKLWKRFFQWEVKYLTKKDKLKMVEELLWEDLFPIKTIKMRCVIEGGRKSSDLDEIFSKREVSE